MPEKSPETQRPATTHHFAATYAQEPALYSKEEGDIAFAAELVAAALVSERQLSAALASWTLHGATALSDHLAQTGLLTPEQRGELDERASARLKKYENESAVDARNGAGGDSMAKSALERLDESGRVAKLLGISVAASGVSGDQFREHTARYQLIRKLGQGGLGTVWLARDMNMQRHVALKEIRSARNASQSALDRFRREAEITGRLEHPGIVPVYQLGEDAATGNAFYAMRFLGKLTLHDAIVEYHERRDEGDDDPMLLRRLLTAFASVCQAIGHAHSRKVIHRDLKPENIAIDNFGQVIVIDWGLAKVLDDGISADSLTESALMESSGGERTMAGQVLGTPLYMAPEQAAGRVDEVDERTDIFGLGAILYAILTGAAPHERSRASSGSTNSRQLMTAIAGGATPRAQAVNADVDPALDAICAKAMARRRYARYESATALADDVQRWMAGEPVLAYRETAKQRVGRWIGHHRGISQLIAAAVVVVLVAGITLGIVSRQNHVAAQQARFEQLRSDGREVEVQLDAAADELGKKVRFMSMVPPIQGIVEARAGAKENEGEQVWRGRLETIYEGLLRANPDYLAVAYVAAGSDAPREIVRVERYSADPASVRRVPESRLEAVEKSPAFAAATALEPGDVKFSLVGLLHGRGKGDGRRLTAAIAVYDEKAGQLFGIVVIETNITQRIKSLLGGLTARFGDTYVTDAQGQVWVSSRPGEGVEVESRAVAIGDLVPQAADFFTVDNAQRQSSDSRTFIAQRVQLDPNDPATALGIVLKLTDE